MQFNDLLLLHIASTWAMVGLIWTVQRVQYPGFALVGIREFAAYHRHHSQRISKVVGPFMAIELVTGIALLGTHPEHVPASLLQVGLALIALNWAWTGLVSVPLHSRMSSRARELQVKLVTTNWVRTAAWSARGVWSLVVLRVAMGPS